MLIQPIASFQMTNVTSMKSKKEREQFLEDVKVALQPFGVNFEVTPYSPRHFVVVATTERIAAMFDCDGTETEPSMIHWHRAYRPMQPVRGVWDEEDINPFHRAKATSFPASFNHILAMLVAGFSAAANGSAFREPCI